MTTVTIAATAVSVARDRGITWYVLENKRVLYLANCIWKRCVFFNNCCSNSSIFTQYTYCCAFM